MTIRFATIRCTTMRFTTMRFATMTYMLLRLRSGQARNLTPSFSFHFMLFGPFYTTLLRQDALFLLNSALKAKLFAVIPKSFCIFVY